MIVSVRIWIESHFSDDRGASMVEYALLVVLIAIVALIAVGATGTAVSSTFDNIATHMNP